jgi:hypothetical protein
VSVIMLEGPSEDANVDMISIHMRRESQEN